MRLRIVSESGKRLWHDWFAWRPVKVGGWTWVWLERVKRRRVTPKNHMEQPHWEYKLPPPRPESEADGTEYYR